MTTKRILPVFLVMMALMLQACMPGQSAESAIQTGVAQTLQISQLETAAAGGGDNGDESLAGNDGDEADSGEDEEPTDTPTITLTPTPSTPYVSVSQDTNCRTGPAVYYGYVFTAEPGNDYEVVATFAGSNYVIIQRPNSSGTCWLWLQYASPTDFSAYGLPVATQPPTPTATYTPTPAFDWSGTWTMWINGSGPYTATFSVSGNTVSGSFSTGANNATFSGTMSNGMQNLSGTWSTDVPSNGTFTWQIKSGNMNQFVGSYDFSGTTYAWCGARSGASMPSPCLWP